jgi:hypothetical protein
MYVHTYIAATPHPMMAMGWQLSVSYGTIPITCRGKYRTPPRGVVGNHQEIGGMSQ